MTRNTKNLISKVKIPSLSTSADLLDLVCNLSTVIVTVGTAVGILANTGDGGSSGGTLTFNIENLSLTFRLVLYLIASAALGWGLGALILRLTAARLDHLTATSYIVSLIWGILLVATADWLATSKSGDYTIAFPIFTVMGFGLMLWLVVFQLRAVTAAPSVSVVTSQGMSILTASIGVILAFFLNLISNF